MKAFAVVLSVFAIISLGGCAGVYVAGDVGAGSSSLDAHPASH